jgi:pyruvate kinase
LIRAVRAVEKASGRPIAILADLQGPKLRVGRFAGGSAELLIGQAFRLDRHAAAGSQTRVMLPHKEIFAAVRPGARLLVDDGKIVLRVTTASDDAIDCVVEVPGTIRDNKGLNIPDVVVPLPALTEKDRADLAFALDNGVDWIGLSFVQRPEDVAEARRLIGGPPGAGRRPLPPRSTTRRSTRRGGRPARRCRSIAASRLSGPS